MPVYNEAKKLLKEIDRIRIAITIMEQIIDGRLKFRFDYVEQLSARIEKSFNDYSEHFKIYMKSVDQK